MSYIIKIFIIYDMADLEVLKGLGLSKTGGWRGINEVFNMLWYSTSGL